MPVRPCSLHHFVRSAARASCWPSQLSRQVTPASLLHFPDVKPGTIRCISTRRTVSSIASVVAGVPVAKYWSHPTPVSDGDPVVTSLSRMARNGGIDTAYVPCEDRLSADLVGIAMSQLAGVPKTGAHANSLRLKPRRMRSGNCPVVPDQATLRPNVVSVAKKKGSTRPGGGMDTSIPRNCLASGGLLRHSAEL